MSKSIKTVMVTAVMLITFLHSSGQRLTYQIFMGTDSIGLLYAEHKVTGVNHNYELRSNMSVNSVVTVEIQYILTALFEKEKLLNSFTEQTVNGRIKVSSTLKWDGKSYWVQTLEKKSKMKNSLIDYNLVCLYFREPVNVTKVYSDTHGTFLNIRNIGPHKYELILPDGKKNIYTYQFGICTEVQVTQFFSKVYFKLVRSSIRPH